MQIRFAIWSPALSYVPWLALFNLFLEYYHMVFMIVNLDLGDSRKHIACRSQFSITQFWVIGTSPKTYTPVA